MQLAAAGALGKRLQLSAMLLKDLRTLPTSFSPLFFQMINPLGLKLNNQTKMRR